MVEKIFFVFLLYEQYTEHPREFCLNKCLMFYCSGSVCNLIQQFSYKNLKNFGWKFEPSDAIVSSKL